MLQYKSQRNTNVMEGVLLIMSILNKKVLTSSLVMILSLGLAGCATNSTTSTHKVNEATSTKVTKKNVKSDIKDEHKNLSTQYSALAMEKSSTKVAPSQNKNTSSTISSSSNSSYPTTSSSATEQSAKSATTSSSNQSNTTQVSTVAATSSNSSAVATKHRNQDNYQEIQLGLGDIASWTDDKGITHHVDSDGMDRQTINDSDQINYQDWSGKLPQNAVVSHNN